METSQIKKFAIEARQKLKQGVAAKLQTLGFDRSGHVADDMKPLLMSGGDVTSARLFVKMSGNKEILGLVGYWVVGLTSMSQRASSRLRR